MTDNKLSRTMLPVLRAYLLWVRFGFQSGGQYSLEGLATRFKVESGDIQSVAEFDPKFDQRVERVLSNRVGLAQLAAVTLISDRLADTDFREKLPTDKLTKLAEYLEKQKQGYFSKSKRERAGGGKLEIEIDLNLPAPEGYDAPKRAKARVKATELLGPDLLGPSSDT